MSSLQMKDETDVFWLMIQSLSFENTLYCWGVVNRLGMKEGHQHTLQCRKVSVLQRCSQMMPNLYVDVIPHTHQDATPKLLL